MGDVGRTSTKQLVFRINRSRHRGITDPHIDIALGGRGTKRHVCPKIQRHVRKRRREERDQRVLCAPNAWIRANPNVWIDVHENPGGVCGSREEVTSVTTNRVCVHERPVKNNGPVERKRADRGRLCWGKGPRRQSRKEQNKKHPFPWSCPENL